VTKLRHLAVLVMLVASAEVQAQRATATLRHSDQFSAVRCDSSVAKALMGRRVTGGRVVEIERAHVDIGLKDLGASEIIDSLWFVTRCSTILPGARPASPSI